MSEAIQFLSEDKAHALYEKLVQQFQNLSRQYDFVLIQGMELTRHAAAIDFDINLALSKNLALCHVCRMN